AVAHRFLPGRAAGHGRQQIEALRRLVVKGAVVGVDHDAHAGDVRVAEKSARRAPQDGLAADGAVLLGNVAGEARAAARSHEESVTAAHRAIVDCLAANGRAPYLPRPDLAKRRPSQAGMRARREEPMDSPLPIAVAALLALLPLGAAAWRGLDARGAI